MTITTTEFPTSALAAKPPAPSAGGVLVSTDGRVLPLQGTRLVADAKGGVARVILEQRFHNHHAEPLHVTYRFPLPHDGAVSGFAFTVGGQRIAGEVDRARAARERYEQALVEGRTAGLLEQARGSVFEQSLGNVPPGADVTAELRIDQPLAWLPEGAWEWRFPTAIAPRYLGAPGRVEDAGRVSVEVGLAQGPLSPRLQLSLVVRDRLAESARLGSPTHALHVEPAAGVLRAAFDGEGGVPLDRDLAVRWAAAAPEVGLSVDACRPVNAGPGRPGGLDGSRAFGLVTLVPPAPGARVAPLRRGLVVLVDTSGSMSGEPLAQARRVVGALVDTLGDEDTLELLAFDNAPRRWKRKPTAATAAAREDAHRWLGKLRADGSTEMRDGIVAALRPLEREAQRQVVLVTDGAIGFEAEIIAEVFARLPAGSRVHVVGVGSAVNRSLTAPVARAGRGLELVLGLGEDPEHAARALVARTAAPLVTGLALSGTALAGLEARPPDLYAGAPALLPVALRPEGGTLRVRGTAAAGPFDRTVTIPPLAAGEGSEAVAALYARDAVEEHELRIAARDGDEAGHEAAIEALGLAFQVSTRLTAWVAIDAERAVNPNAPFREETVPQALPHGLSIAGLGLRYAFAEPALAGVACAAPAPSRRRDLDVPRAQAFDFDLDEELPPRRPRFEAATRSKRSPTLPPKWTPSGPDLGGGFTATYRWVGDTLVITLVRTGPELAWAPPAEVVLHPEAGDPWYLPPDLGASTGPSPLPPGARARLVVTWPDGTRPALVAFALQLGDASFRVPLRPAAS